MKIWLLPLNPPGTPSLEVIEVRWPLVPRVGEPIHLPGLIGTVRSVRWTQGADGATPLVEVRVWVHPA